MAKCEVCGIDVHFWNIDRTHWRVNSPMLKNEWWKKVCDFYEVPYDTEAICDSCMEEAIGELNDDKLRKCMITAEWKNPNLECYMLSFEELEEKLKELGMTETEGDDEEQLINI